MTESVSPAEPATEIPADPGTETEPKPGSEAARYRVRLRDAEGQRDTLAARVERMQRADVERIAGAKVAVAGDLFTVGGVNLADLLDDQGDVVPELVDTAVLGLLADRPGLAKQLPVTRDLGQGARQPVATGPTWTNLIRARR